jgi:hypothetical protein
VPSSLLEALTHSTDARSLNLARLEFQRHATPSEVRDSLEVAPELPKHVSDWLDGLHEYCFFEKEDPEPFGRLTVDPSWSLYGSSDQGRSGRELIIGFTGGAHNLFQPAAVILQQLEAARHDLLLLRDRNRDGFLEGAGDFRSIGDLAKGLGHLTKDYRSVVTIGSSRGGFAAVLMGLALGARRAVSIGGHPSRLSASFITESGLTEGDRRTEVLCIYGDGNERDRAGAEAMRQLLPIALAVPVADCAEHNVPHEAFQRGSLGFLYEWILDEVPVTQRLEIPRGAGQGRLVLVQRVAPPAWLETRASVAVRVWISQQLWRIVRREGFPASVAAFIEESYRFFGISVPLERGAGVRPSL